MSNLAFVLDYVLNGGLVCEGYDLLFEDRLPALHKKWANISSAHDDYAKHRDAKDIVNHIAQHDPTKNKQYTDWMLHKYHKGQYRQEDMPRIHRIVSDWDKHKSKLGPLQSKDINRYDTVGSVQRVVAPFADKLSKRAEAAAADEKAKAGARVVHKDDNLTVLHLQTKEAAKLYGRNTQWCTAAEHDNMFHHYNNHGPIYALIDHKNKRKYQLHFGSHQLMDETDTPVDHEKLAKEHPVLGHIPEFQEDGYKSHMFVDRYAVHQKIMNGEHKKFSSGFLHHIASNEETPSEVLHKMSTINRSTTLKSTHQELGTERWQESVPQAVAGNKSATKETLHGLLDHPDHKVVRSAYINLDGRAGREITSWALGNKPTRDHVNDYFDKHNAMMSNVNQKLATHPHNLIRTTVAGRTTDPELLRSMGNHRSPHVTQSVAHNPHTPSDVLDKLAEKHPYHVSNNPSTDKSTIHRMALRGHSEFIRRLNKNIKGINYSGAVPEGKEYGTSR